MLNRLTAAGVFVTRAQSGEGVLTIHAPRQSRQKIIAIFTQMCYNYKIIKSYGAEGTLHNIWTRKGLVFVMLAAIVFFALMPAFVLDIQVESQNVQESAVLEVLESNGVKRGAYLKNFDKDALTLAVQSIEGVSFATVVRKGTTVFVKLYEELPPAVIPDADSVKPVVCVTDAVVTRQIVFSGTPLFKRGDVARKGDTLIGAYSLVGEEKVPQTARGEVYGYVYYSASMLYYETRVERVRSGESATWTNISFLGLSPKRPSPPFAMYESVSTIYKGGFLFPIERETITFYEMVDAQVYEPFAEAKDRIAGLTEEAAFAKIPADAKIINYYTQVRPQGEGAFLVETVYQTERRIDNCA